VFRLVRTLAVIGLQFGDEGKGKIVDFLSSKYDIVARYQGGSNAGHTVRVSGNTYKFHLIPSGIIQGAICVLGNGMVIDPIQLKNELEMVKDFSPLKKIRISERAHVVMPYHLDLDIIEENLKSEKKVGTTGKGIGPAYEDKYARVGIRMGDLLDKEKLEKKIRIAIKMRKNLLEKDYDANELSKRYSEIGKMFKKNIIDTSSFLISAIDKGKSVLFEGAQGTHLDVDFGMYPYVTSSNTFVGGAITGLGIPPRYISNVLGIMKAYTTKVGEGPFPTELKNEIGENILKKGNEYGTTTGRPRRIGWLDLSLVRYSVKLSGVKYIAISKIDILSGFSEVKVAYAYEYKGKIIRNIPSDPEIVAKLKPIYTTFDGWDFTKDDIRNDIPKNMKKYISFIERNTGAKVTIISLGASREDTKVLKAI